MFPQIEAAIRQALIGQERDDLAVLKLLKSDILAEAKARRQDEPPDDICQLIIQRHLKQYREAIQLYDQLGQPDQAADKRRELAVIESLLPPQLSPEELAAIVAEELDGVQDPQAAGLGPMIQQVRNRVGNRSPAGDIAQAVRRQLKL